MKIKNIESIIESVSDRFDDIKTTFEKRKKDNEIKEIMMTLQERDNITRKKIRTLYGCVMTLIGTTIAGVGITYYQSKDIFKENERIVAENKILNYTNNTLNEEIVETKEFYTTLEKELDFAMMNSLAIGGMFREEYDLARSIAIAKKDNIRIQDLSTMAVNEEIRRNIEEHGLIKYNLRYNWLGYPIDEPEKAYVSSPFGWRILSGEKQYHKGIDIVSYENKRVISSADGKIITIKYDDKTYGNYMIIEHYDNLRRPTNTTRILYAHFDTMEPLKPRAVVTKGQQLGVLGETGYSFGVHLHYEILEKNRIGQWTLKNPVTNSTYGILY